MLVGCGDGPTTTTLGGNVQELPDEDLAEDFLQMAADEMNQLLRDTLADVIAQKCEEIEPPRGPRVA